MNAHPKYAVPSEARSLYGAVTDDDLRVLQDDLGNELPGDLLDFLKAWNGVLFTQELWFPLRDALDEDEFGTVYRIYGVAKEQDSDDLRYAGDGYHFSQRVPPRFLAIGDNNHWNRVCLSIGSPDFGQVYNWQPGEGWPREEEVATMDYMHPVADSFSEFWSLLQVLDID